MAEERKISLAEVRKTISTSLAAAFGFVIALLWNNVVTSGLKLTGTDLSAPGLDAFAWGKYVVTAVIITIVMIVLIVVIGRWGSKD